MKILSIIIDQCLLSHFSEKFISMIYITITLRVMIYFLRVNLAFMKVTLACIKGFDANPWLDTCRIFFDISKPFHRVWHEVLISKLWSYGISDSLLCSFNSFLSERLKWPSIWIDESARGCLSRLSFRTAIVSYFY